jgi:hypothetical protein
MIFTSPAASNPLRGQRLPFKSAFLQGFLFLAVSAGISAQETLLEELPVLRERAVVVRMVSRIVEQNEQVVWNSEKSRVTMPGRPVGLKLVGTNVLVSVQFTPVLQPYGQHILVAQGQIWINVPGEGMRYHTSIQTIPLEFNEQVFFFPLGSMQERDEASIEIQLVVEPYSPAFVGRGQGRSSQSMPQTEEDSE